MTAPASIEKLVGHMTPMQRVIAALSIAVATRCPSGCGCDSPSCGVMVDALERAIIDAENAVLDRIIDATSRSASRGAQRIAELAQSMKHKETAR